MPTRIGRPDRIAYLVQQADVARAGRDPPANSQGYYAALEAAFAVLDGSAQTLLASDKKEVRRCGRTVLQKLS